MTNSEILKYMLSKLEWDGFGYWLPEWLIKEASVHGAEFTPEPTFKEFKQALIDHAKANYRGAPNA